MLIPLSAVRRTTCVIAAGGILEAAAYAGPQSADATAEYTPASEPMSLTATAPPSRPSDRRENNGEDETRPLTRVDFRTRFESLSPHRDEWIFTLRADTPFPLGNGWQFATRIDAPIDVSNKTSSDNRVGDYRGGLGDLFFQGLLVDQVDDRNAFAVGTRISFPTATQDQFGQGTRRAGVPPSRRGRPQRHVDQPAPGPWRRRPTMANACPDAGIQSFRPHVTRR